jgi:membrane fusion protein (multidrug efflux system)
MGRVIRTIIILLVSVAIGYGIWWKLRENKRQMEAQLEFTMEQEAQIPVTAAAVVRDSFDREFTVNGSFEASKETVVVPTVSGRIVALHVRTGSYVREGQTLLQVDNEYTQNELKAAEIELKNARRDLERLENLVGEGGVTEQQYEEVKTKVESGEVKLESLRKRLKDSDIKAPISGHISLLPQRPMPVEGGFVGQGNPLFQIVNIDRLTLTVLLTADQVIRVREGQKVRVTADVYPGHSYQGEIGSIGIKTDMFSKRYPVGIELDNHLQYRLRAGMNGKAYFELGATAAMLVIPREAFAGSVREGEVFVVKDGQAERRKVETGEIFGSQVEILRGLEEGEQVVLSGQINLEEGSAVRIID